MAWYAKKKKKKRKRPASPDVVIRKAIRQAESDLKNAKKHLDGLKDAFKRGQLNRMYDRAYDAGGYGLGVAGLYTNLSKYLRLLKDGVDVSHISDVYEL